MLVNNEVILVLLDLGIFLVNLVGEVFGVLDELLPLVSLCLDLVCDCLGYLIRVVHRGFELYPVLLQELPGLVELLLLVDDVLLKSLCLLGLRVDRDLGHQDLP